MLARIANRIETMQVGMLCRIDSQMIQSIFAHQYGSPQHDYEGGQNAQNRYVNSSARLTRYTVG